jgi:hypothetical protein
MFSSGEPPRFSIRIPSTNVTVIPDILRALERFADSPNACEEASHFLWVNTAKKSGQHELAKMHATKAIDCYDLHMGTRLENSKNEADKAQYAKPFPPEQAPRAIGRFDSETAFEKIGNNYRPSVVTF